MPAEKFLMKKRILIWRVTVNKLSFSILTWETKTKPHFFLDWGLNSLMKCEKFLIMTSAESAKHTRKKWRRSNYGLMIQKGISNRKHLQQHLLNTVRQKLHEMNEALNCYEIWNVILKPEKTIRVQEID